MELVLVVFALFVIATPFATVYLLWRERELRQQLLKLTNLSMEVGDGLRRDLLELKRQVEAAAAVPATGPVQPAVQPAVVSPVSVPPPVPCVEKVAELNARQKQDATPPVAVPPVHPKPDQTLPEESAPQAPAAVEKTAQKPVPPLIVAPVPPPIAAAPPSESKPSGPVAPTNVIPGKGPEPTRPPSAATPPPLSRAQMPPTKAPTSAVVSPPTPVAPPTVARVGAPPQHATFRSSAPASAGPSFSIPTATAEQRMKSVFALEEVFGKNWLNKIGIVLIVLGVAYFGIKELGQLGPVGKVVLSYVTSLALLGGGIFLERRERYRVFSYAFLGGGWALLFWTTYALNHVAGDADREFRQHRSRLHAPGGAGDGGTYAALPLAGGHRHRVSAGVLDGVAQQ